MFTFFASTCMAIWKLSRSKVKWGARLLGQFVLFYTLCKKYLMKYCCHQNCKIHAEWHKESWAIHSLRNFLFFFLIISPKLVCYIGLKCSEINAATLFFHILQVLNSSYSLTYVIRYSTILKAGTKHLCHTCVSYIPKQTNLCLFSLRVAAMHTQPNVHANSYPHRCTEGRGGGGWWNSSPEFLIFCSISKRFWLHWKAFDLLYKMRYILCVVVLMEARNVTKNRRHLGFYQELEIRLTLR